MGPITFGLLLAAATLIAPVMQAQIRTPCEGSVVIGNVNTGVTSLLPNGLCLQMIVDQCRQPSPCDLASCLGPVTTLLKQTDVAAIISAVAQFALSLQEAPCPDKVWADIKPKDKKFTTTVCAPDAATARTKARKTWSDDNLHASCGTIAAALGVKCTGKCDPGQACWPTAQGVDVVCDRNPAGDAACKDKTAPLSYKCTAPSVACNCICR